MLPSDFLSPPIVASSFMMPCDVVPTDARVCGDKAAQMSNLIGLAGPLNEP